MRTVTVVIPTYNRLSTLIAAIDSVKRQTYAPSEIIVVDDGSTDGSVGTLRTVSGITLIEQANAGVGAARDRGARAGSGELIAFLDHDDTWRPTKLETQIPMFDDPTVALVHSAGRLYNPDSGWEAVGYTADDIGFHEVLNYQVPAIQSVVVRRSVYEDVGGFDITLSGTDDWDFFLRLSARHRMLGTPEVLIDVDAIPGLGANVPVMFAGQMRVLKRARQVHTGCSTCLQIAARTERVIRMYAVESEKARAVRFRAEHKQIKAAWTRIAAYRYDPVALARLPGRIAKKATGRR